MARFITRIAFAVSALGLFVSIAGQVMSFHPRWQIAPAWFLVPFLAIFPLHVFGVYVCWQLGEVHGVWGSKAQWEFFDARMPKYVPHIRTGLFLYTLIRFAWFAATDASNEDADIPLGLASAFTALSFVTLLIVFHAALQDSLIAGSYE